MIRLVVFLGMRLEQVADYSVEILPLGFMCGVKSSHTIMLAFVKTGYAQVPITIYHAPHTIVVLVQVIDRRIRVKPLASFL